MKSLLEDREGYDSFRADCEGHLEQFLQAHPPEVFDDKMKKSILHIVRYMGNPGYEANWSELEKNERQGDAEQQRNNRNFMHRILTIAHKLDLLRCYTPNEYELAMKPCIELSEISDEQKLDYQQIIKYASDLIKAHGNELYTDINDKGDYILAHQSYRAPFEEVSTNLKQLFLISDTVTRPTFSKCSIRAVNHHHYDDFNYRT